jgi:hypothetical protein
MSIKRITAFLMAGALALAACSSETVDDVTSELESATDVSVADDVEQDAMELAAEVQDEMSTLGTEIQNSDAADDLQAAWNEMQGEVTAALASMGTDGTISTEGLEEGIDEFQTALDSAGDEIGPEITEAWNSLRDKVESLMG